MDTDRKQKKILVVFYSQSGVTRRIAEMLQSRTQADLYEIETIRTIRHSSLMFMTSPKKSWKPAIYQNSNVNRQTCRLMI